MRNHFGSKVETLKSNMFSCLIAKHLFNRSYSVGPAYTVLVTQRSRYSRCCSFHCCCCCCLQAYAAEHGSNSSSGQASNLTGVVTLHSGSSSTVGRIRPRPFNLGAAKAAGANAEVPDDIVYSDAAATAAAEALLSESMRRGTMDNVTVIVMLLQWS